MEGTSRFEHLPSFVKDFLCGLEQKKAALWLRGENAPTSPFVNNLAVIGSRVIAKDGQFKTIPATRFGVAGTIVATSLGENGLNVVQETEGWIAGCRVNGDRHMAYDVSAGVARFQKGAAWFHGKPGRSLRTEAGILA